MYGYLSIWVDISTGLLEGDAIVNMLELRRWCRDGGGRRGAVSKRRMRMRRKIDKLKLPKPAVVLARLAEGERVKV